jgi:hypothetical protein
LKFQRTIGAPTDAAAWLNDQHSAAKTSQRLQFLQEIKDSQGTDDITMPAALTEMRKFREWNEHFVTYLRVKRGAANVPLAYLIRSEENVTQGDRDGTVGSSPTDAYRNWDEYSIRCAVFADTHYETDNAALWQILSELVRDGPGWDFIRKFEKKGDGNGRKAYKAIYEQAFQHTNVSMIKAKARADIEALRYDGPTKKWNYDKYVRAWERNISILREFGGCPDEETLVNDFCTRITDPRLTETIKGILDPSSRHFNNFQGAQMAVNHSIHLQQRVESNRKPNTRNVSAMNYQGSGSNNGKGKSYSGTLEGKHYDLKIWKSMNNKQKEIVRKKRKDNAIALARDNESNKKARVSEANTSSQPEDKRDNAGDQFGRKAHSKTVRFDKDGNAI